MKRDTVRALSLGRLTGMFFAILYLAIVLLYAVTQGIIIRQVSDNVEKSIRREVEVNEKAIDNSLEMIDKYLYENYYLDTPNSISKQCYAYTNGKNIIQKSEALRNLSKMVQSLHSWTDNVSFDMMIINDKGNYTWLDAGDSDTYTIRTKLKEMVELNIEDPDAAHLTRYMDVDSDGKTYIVRLMKLDNCYFVVGLSQKAIINQMMDGRFSDKSICFVTDENGKLLMSSANIDFQIDLLNDGKYIKLGNEKYLQAGYQSGKTGYYFGVLTDRKSIRDQFIVMRIVFIVVFVLLTVLMWLSRTFVERFIQRPISGLIDAMKEVEKGNLDVQITGNSPILEFKSLVGSFTHMVNRIKTLKIEKYESELRSQKATMQYLQLQIKPHFYANLLNIIYSLAQARDFENIQRVSKAIVGYSRYMFSDATDMVELRREVEFLKNYMEIQEIRYREQIELNLNIPDNLLDALVPPFVIQGFVENSVKYGFDTKASLVVTVTVSLSENKENLLIEIKDNGKGYTQELLDGGFKTHKVEGHVGLTNIYQRLRLIYEDDADIVLSNDNGAKSNIVLPHIDMGISDEL